MLGSFDIPAGKIATVTASAAFAATVTRLSDAPGDGTTYAPVSISAGGSTTIGPFAYLRRYQFDSAAEGTVSYSTPEPDSDTTDNTLADGVDFTLGTSTGTKIGTATGQKLAFHNATPVIQRASANQTAVTDNTGGSVADAIAAAVTAPTALTDSTGGAASATLAAITNAANAGSADVAPVADALASIAARQAEDRSAIVALTNGLAKTIELANELRAALVEKGIIKGSA